MAVRRGFIFSLTHIQAPLQSTKKEGAPQAVQIPRARHSPLAIQRTQTNEFAFVMVNQLMEVVAVIPTSTACGGTITLCCSKAFSWPGTSPRLGASCARCQSCSSCSSRVAAPGSLCGQQLHNARPAASGSPLRAVHGNHCRRLLLACQGEDIPMAQGAGGVAIGRRRDDQPPSEEATRETR